MLAFNRKRQTSLSDQDIQAKRRAQTNSRMCVQLQRLCCNCAKIFSIPHTLLSCTECDHTICRRCPVNDPLLVDSCLNPQETISNEHGDMGSNAEGLQAQEFRLQSQPTKRHEEVETEGPSKRSLNMTKCERCRLDKKKCLPVDRVWPKKCELCTKKGFSCSESKRVVRSTKHALTPSLSPKNETSTLVTSVSFEERLKQWTFLLSYRKMMMTAKSQLEELKTDTISVFSFKHFVSRNHGLSYHRFLKLVDDELDYIIYKCSEELLSLDPPSKEVSGWSLITSVSQLGSRPDIHIACSACYPARSQSNASEFESSQDTCGKLLLLQHRSIRHENIGNWRRYMDLSHEVVRRAGVILESFGSHYFTNYVRIIGVWHPGQVIVRLPDSIEDLQDCLERSPLHSYMELASVSGADRYGFDFKGDLSKLKDRQDMLGRTALLMACQIHWKDAVQRLLEEQAEPGLATVYGSLPLHYAAVNGSLDICKLLLAHKTRFNMKAKDCLGRTALYWAKEKKHHVVIDLLSAEYAAADRDDEELSRAQSLQAEKENYEVQGSYFA